MPIALTKPQLDQVTTIAAQVPRHLRPQFLQRLAELLWRWRLVASGAPGRARGAGREVIVVVRSGFDLCQ